MSEAPLALGRRVVVTGLAGSGKSTFSLGSRPRPACRSFISTSTSGSPAGLHRRRPNGARSSVTCSPATRGSPTATTTRPSISGSNVRTPLCFSTCPGGCAQDACSCAASECRPSCPKGATIRPGCGCATSGVWPSASGGNARAEPEREHEIISQHGQHVALSRAQIQAGGQRFPRRSGRRTRGSRRWLIGRRVALLETVACERARQGRLRFKQSSARTRGAPLRGRARFSAPPRGRTRQIPRATEHEPCESLSASS